MPVNLSVKNVPDDLADRLRQRAARNRRSLQQELLSILESATEVASSPQNTAQGPGQNRGQERPIPIDDLIDRTRELFPNGTESSVDYIRKLRDSR
jgi:plasmid stability protein